MNYITINFSKASLCELIEYSLNLQIEISSFNDNELVAENLNEQGFVQGETAT